MQRVNWMREKQLKIILLFIFIIGLFTQICNITTPHPQKFQKLKGSDFSVTKFPFPFISQTGAYRFFITIENSGNNLVTPTVVPIVREDFYHQLVLINGEGTLNESELSLDLNGNGRKTDIFPVKWFQNATRFWDATISGHHVYAIYDSMWMDPNGFPRVNQSCYIGEKSKLFQLGNETHVLYFANNNSARFGFLNAEILTYTGPNYEFQVDSSITIADVDINGERVKPIYSWTEREISERGTVDVTRYIIVYNETIPMGREVTIQFTLISFETKLSYFGFFWSWSINNDIKNILTLVDSVDQAQAIDAPYFGLIEDKRVETGEGDLEFSITLKNYGVPTDTGTLLIPWEERTYELAMVNGEGVLNESVIDFDLNGDGDKKDTYEVTWFHNETRVCDAIIDGNHVYAIQDYGVSGEGIAFGHRNYSINGKSKFFQLGNITHSMYYCYEHVATFGLGLISLGIHPSPNIQLMAHFFNLSVTEFNIEDISIGDFKINDQPIQPNYTISIMTKILDEKSSVVLFNIIPLKTTKIESQEKIVFSWNIKSLGMETIIIDILRIWVNWSPDGELRYIWAPFYKETILLSPHKTTTSTISSTTSTTTTSEPTSAFSFLSCFSLIIPVVYSYRHRKHR